MLKKDINAAIDRLRKMELVGIADLLEYAKKEAESGRS